MINSIIKTIKDNRLIEIADKVLNGERITTDDGIYLFKHAEVGYLGTLANYIREHRHGNKTFFNKNFHISNIGKKCS